MEVIEGGEGRGEEERRGEGRGGKGR